MNFDCQALGARASNQSGRIQIGPDAMVSLYKGETRRWALGDGCANQHI